MHIGNGSIIGTNSVVTKIVPVYHITGDNSCRIIRKSFDDELAGYLVDMK